MKVILPALWLCIFPILFCAIISGQTLAPGGPGKDAQWLTAGKQAFGTSSSIQSKVWFTLAEGVMTEVLYPNVGTANVQMLQFVVADPKTKKVETEMDDAVHQIRVLRPDSLTFQQVNTAKSGKWKFTKTYVTDPTSNVIAIEVTYSGDAANEIYVYYDPSLNNSGMHDSAWTQHSTLVAADSHVASAISCGRCAFTRASNDFLSDQFDLLAGYQRAVDGNVIQRARIDSAAKGSSVRRFQIFLAFATTAELAIGAAENAKARSFLKMRQTYEKGWAGYVKTLPKVESKFQAQFNMAAMVVKGLEDKTVRGANIASPSIPWGGGGNANEAGNGYRMIWSRDLYHVFTAFLAIGDKAAATRALDFLFNIQQKPDGSFPQNSWLDGKQGWGSLQMDEVAYPLIMAWQLGRFDKRTYEKHVKPAADFIVRTGPSSLQERWEERPGYSPSTIAAEIAGLVCAADIAKRNRDGRSAEVYLRTADAWQANIEKWTATTTGKYGDGRYYLRITRNGKPDAGEKVELNNNSGTFDEREIVDAGFLELVRLGIKPADDPLIVKSLKIVDQLLKAETPNGETFYRYTHDGYGEEDDGRKWNWDGKYTGKGRPWPLLAGERGQYEIAAANTPIRFWVTGTHPHDLFLEFAKKRLDAMLGFANDALMIPEQVWDKKEIPANYDRRFVPQLRFGEGTGSATPLAWSMAQFIRLAVNLKAGANADTPQIVFERYAAVRRGASAL